MPNVIIALDPGAERMGYVALEEKEDGHFARGSGIIGLKRGTNEEYQVYRIRLVDFFIERGEYLIRTFKPTVIVNEIIPPVGGNAANQIQRQLALTALTTVQTVARQHEVSLVQLSAQSVKAKIGGNRKATKTTIRNNVFNLLPSTKVFKKQWTGVYDESDAYAVGLTYLGYNVKEQRTVNEGTSAS